MYKNGHRFISFDNDGGGGGVRREGKGVVGGGEGEGREDVHFRQLILGDGKMDRIFQKYCPVGLGIINT